MTTPTREDFPYAPQDWDIKEALSVAADFGLELTFDHWEAIAGLQEYFSKHELGNRRELVDALDEKFHTTLSKIKFGSKTPNNSNMGCA